MYLKKWIVRDRSSVLKPRSRELAMRPRSFAASLPAPETISPFYYLSLHRIGKTVIRITKSRDVRHLPRPMLGRR